MKINKVLVLAILLASILAITVVSQISQNTISVEDVKTCTTNFYDEVQNVYSNCIYYSNYTSCLNSSGPNTECSLQQAQINFTCKTGEVAVTKNLTQCTPPEKFIVSTTRGSTIDKKEIDFSKWGACIHSTENNCLIVTCVSLYDGAHKGQFTDCKGGKSCQKFRICENDIKVFYKNSREDFVEEDPTFYLEKLAMMEVGK